MTRSDFEAMRLAMGRSGRTVASYVHAEHEAFVRILNPARDRNGPRSWRSLDQNLGAGTSDLQWSDVSVAAADADVEAPVMGSVDPSVAQMLVSILAAPESDRIFVAQWDGYADVSFPAAAMRVELPPARESRVWEIAKGELLTLERVPMRWWHPSLDWVVGNDIYARSVFVSGNSALVASIVDSDLEAFIVSPGDRVGAEDL